METQSVFQHSNVLAHRAVSAQAGVSTLGDLNLVTREGDRVNISFGSEQSVSGSRSQTRRADGTVVQALSLTAIAASRYSISVEGDLNEDELAAIQKLVGVIDPLAEDFFAGRELDLPQAASALADNMGAVSELALTLEKTVFASVAASQFSDTPQQQNGPNPPSAQNTNALETIRDFPALVESVLESVFSRHGAGVLDDAVLIRKFGDFVEFLKERLEAARQDDSGQAESASPSPASSHETVA